MLCPAVEIGFLGLQVYCHSQNYNAKISRAAECRAPVPFSSGSGVQLCAFTTIICERFVMNVVLLMVWQGDRALYRWQIFAAVAVLQVYSVLV